jgi:hypothetical protein
MRKQILPLELISQQRKAGLARWIGVTPAERVAHGKRAWQKRVERYRQEALIVARTLPAA